MMCRATSRGLLRNGFVRSHSRPSSGTRSGYSISACFRASTTEQYARAALPRGALERAVRRLLLALRRQEARLPPSRARVVAHQEPDEDVDASVRTRDSNRLPHVRGLARERDAEEPVGRVRLEAVLGDPDRLVALPQLVDLADEVVDVAELHVVATARARPRRLRLVRVVRVVCEGVEVLQAGLLERADEGQRRDRRTARARAVVPSRPGRPARDRLAREVRVVDA